MLYIPVSSGDPKVILALIDQVPQPEFGNGGGPTPTYLAIEDGKPIRIVTHEQMKAESPNVSSRVRKIWIS